MVGDLEADRRRRGRFLPLALLLGDRALFSVSGRTDDSAEACRCRRFRLRRPWLRPRRWWWPPLPGLGMGMGRVVR